MWWSGIRFYLSVFLIGVFISSSIAREVAAETSEERKEIYEQLNLFGNLNFFLEISTSFCPTSFPNFFSKLLFKDCPSNFFFKLVLETSLNFF